MRILLSSLLTGVCLLLHSTACSGEELNLAWLEDSSQQAADVLEQGVWLTAAVYLMGTGTSVGVFWIPPQNWSVKLENSKNRILLSAPDLHSSIFLRLEPERLANNKTDWKQGIGRRLKERHPKISEWETQVRTNKSCEIVVFEGRRVIPLIGEVINHVEVLRFPEVQVELALLTDDASRLRSSIITLRRMIDSVRPLTPDEWAKLPQ